MRSRILTAFAVALAVALGARFGRSYPWELAAIAGVLFGGLAFVTLQTLVRLKATLSQFGPKK